jgi:hypothetical protein
MGKIKKYIKVKFWDNTFLLNIFKESHLLTNLHRTEILCKIQSIWMPFICEFASEYTRNTVLQKYKKILCKDPQTLLFIRQLGSTMVVNKKPLLQLLYFRCKW